MTMHLLAAASDTDWAIIADLVVILVSAAVVAIAAQPMRLATIPAYLAAGAIIGPHALGLVPAPGSLGAISHLAIILLLFGIGLELHLSVFRNALVRMAMTGFGSCLITVLAGWPVAMMFGLPPSAALTISMAFALSSTAVVLRIIAARRELHRMHGRLALSILVAQDMIVLGMLAALPAIADWTAEVGQATDLQEGATAAGANWLSYVGDAVVSVAAAILLVAASRFVLPRVLQEAQRGRSLEVMTIVGVAGALLAAVAMQALGFSLEMGAFLAGFVLAGTPFRHQLSGQVGPLRDVFIAVFFTTLGMKLDFAVLIESWWVIVLGGVAMMTIKAIVISATSWTLGTSARLAILVGFALAQAGEFSLIVLDTANGLKIIDNATMANAVAIVVLSLLFTPGLIEVGQRLAATASGIGTAPWIGAGFLREPSKAEHQTASRRHVIVAGYGPIGQLVSERLREADIGYTVVELNAAVVNEQRSLGEPIILGDVGNNEVLESAGLGEADALILTIPDEEAVLRACAIVRMTTPEIFIAARTRVLSRENDLKELGADSITVDESSAAEAMAAKVMRHFSDQAAEPREVEPAPQ